MPTAPAESVDVLIVGGGLAGACAALFLSRHASVLLVEAAHPAAGASGAAAGLVNPLMSQRARPVWRCDEALAALHEALALAGAERLFGGGGVLRPAADARQAERFREAADAFPRHGRWLAPAEVQARFPDVAAPEGALLVVTGGAVAVPALVEAFLQAAVRSGARVRTGLRATGWAETDTGVTLDVVHVGGTERLRAGRLLLALGGAYVDAPDLAGLRLHRVKGQTVRVRRPALAAGGSLPHLAGAGYVVAEADTLVVGSSYEHQFRDLQPDPARTREILARAAGMLPALEGAAVLEARAGVRVTVPGLRLPMVGPLPGRSRLWVFTGLGSKGLLLAPLVARSLPAFFADPEAIPPEIRVRIAADGL